MIITLLSDFGLKGGFSAILKGVIWSIAPGIQIADITHEINPQNIWGAAVVLRRTASFFPEDTIHVAIVDPGVGTARRPLAARIGDQFFVGPDNGLITLFLEKAELADCPVSLFHLTNPDYWLGEISHTFQGRDIFSPVAAHLANGVPLEKMGEPIHDPVRIKMTQPKKISGGWRGQVIDIDSFGNILTNLGSALVQKGARINIKIAGVTIAGLVNTYGEGKTGDVIGLVNSEKIIEVAVVNGNAARGLKVTGGEPVTLMCK